MNRLILGRVAATALARIARVRACVAAFALLALALLATPASAVTNAWAPAGSLATARQLHTATLLSSGKVLVVGGACGAICISLASAELYDPAANAWSAAAPLATARFRHTATRLPSGKVLVAGGEGGSGNALASAELYDPATNTWSPAASMATARSQPTATLLPSGKVLVAGGVNGGSLASAELYDPATNRWSAAGALAVARQDHTATLLPSGKVLAVGGYSGGFLASAELYDPATNTWSAVGNLATARRKHTATLLPSGKVLVAGGYQSSGDALASAELYDPATDTWSAAGALGTARHDHKAALLPSGRVLVAGGKNGSRLASADSYDPATNTWSATGNLAVARENHTITLLPSGRLLALGGIGDPATLLSSAELYDSAAGAWSAVGALAAARDAHTATLLPSGQVLAVGGLIGNHAVASAERYDPATNTWNAAGDLGAARYKNTATLLPSGRVLVAGGASSSGYLASVELYDPAANAWSAAGALAQARTEHTATLLPSGRVLVVGGFNGSIYLANAESYDPATSTWSAAAALTTRRSLHTATLLPSGRVLVTGGATSADVPIASAELYDPATNTWSTAGALGTARFGHTATLLPSGRVLVAGGANSAYEPVASAELYDPATNTWSAAGAMASAHEFHTATLLSSGRVLVAGGFSGGSNVPIGSAELYDPATNAWSVAGTMASARALQTATLLPSGQVLVAGGSPDGYVSLGCAELYDPGLAPVAVLRPGLGAVNPFLLQTSPLAAASPGSATVANAVTATGFMPQREGGGGESSQSAGNAPVFQVQRIDNDQMRFIPNDGSIAMTDTTFTGAASALAGFPAGPVLARAWVNGVPSVARYSTLAVTPGKVAAPSAAGGPLQASVSFADVTETGGTPVTSYTVTASPGGETANCSAPCTSIVFSPLDPGDYTFTVHATNAAGSGPESPASNAATVTAATPALDWSAPAAIVYGTPLGAAQLNATATYNGNPVAGTFAYAPAVGSVLSAGNGQVLSVTFVPSDTLHYASATASASIDVTPAPLTVAGTSVQNKSYDGTTAATLTGGTLVGVIAVDTGNVVLSQAGTFAQANVGAAIAVTANDAITGSAAGNYTLIQPTGLSASITSATLTYTATPLTMPYGTTPSGLGGTVTGFITGESQATATTGTLAFTTTATASSGPGQYSIIGSGLSANAGNYVFVQAAGNLTALTIERAAQAALNLVATPDVLIPDMTSQLAVSGGSGSGAVSYGVDSGPCNVSGSVATATGVGICVVRATKAADANYGAADATATLAVQAAVPPTAHPRSVAVAFNTARTIQLVGDDTNPGGPYAMTYAIVDAPLHGTLAGFDAASGAPTYTPAVDYVGADRFTFTVSSVNGVSHAATVSIAVAAPQLALSIEDGRDFARYGQVVDYTVTLTNAGDAANAVPVTFVLSAGFDAEGSSFTCMGAIDGATCVQDAADPLHFTATLPPGRSLTWLVSALARSDAAGDTVAFGVDAVGAGTAVDTNVLVVFRDSFDVRNGDGTQAARVVEGEQARAILESAKGEQMPAATIPLVAPDVTAATLSPAAWLIVRDAAREVRIEARTVAGASFVRLRLREANEGERASAWSAVEPGAALVLGAVSDDDGKRVFLLEGAHESLMLH